MKKVAGPVLAAVSCVLACHCAVAVTGEDWANTGATLDLVRLITKSHDNAPPNVGADAPPPTTRPSPDFTEERNRKDAIEKMKDALCGKYVLLEFKGVLVARMGPDQDRLGDWYFRDPKNIASLEEVARETGQHLGLFPKTDIEPATFPNGKTVGDMSLKELAEYDAFKQESIEQAAKKTLADYTPGCPSI